MNVSIPDCFMIAFLAGVLFGLVYELLRVIRLILRFSAVTFLCDIAFFILAAFFVCKLSEFLGSYVRLYTILGFGAGVFTYIVTLGRLFNALESAASIVWKRTLGRLFHKIGSCARKTAGKISQKSCSAFGKIHKYSSNIAKKRLEHLHLRNKKMYNKKGNVIVGEGENPNVIKAKVRKSG